MLPNLQKYFLQAVKFFLCSFLFFFSQKIYAQAPANNVCGSAVTLTPSLVTCSSPTAGTINNATQSSPALTTATCSGSTAPYDVWYKFTAVSTIQTITINNFGANFWSPEVAVYNGGVFPGTCPTGAAATICCSNTLSGVAVVTTATTFTVGNVYFIRVSDSWSPHTSDAGFNICVTYPLSAVLQDACATAYLLTSGNSCSPTTGNLFNAANAAAAGAPSGSCGAPITAATTYDVWFRFQATSATHTVTLSNFGSSMTAANTYIETFGGTCAALGIALGCQTAATRQTLTGLTVGNFYYVRVYVKTNPNTATLAAWNFDICIQSQPANDECAGAVLLTSNTTCTNTAGTLDLATANAATPIGCFAAGTYYDVWYRFIAVTPTHTITLSSLGAGITAQRIQLYSGNCGALTSITCVSGNTITQPGLIPGNVYYIRVANFNVNPSGMGVANFNICVTHTNDLCLGALQLTSASTCTNVTSTLLNATATAGLPACGNSSSADVWFSFTAVSNFPVITLSNIGSNLNTAGPLIQLFSGSCGSLVPVGTCAASPLNTAVNPGGTGLSINTVYYVRITTNTNTGTPVTGNWGFDICITNPAAASVDYAKSYINVTDGTVGGTINTGDVLEIRATLVVALPGGLGAPTRVAIDSIAYYDTLFANKGFKLLKDSMAVRTNEGKLFRPSSSTYYTDAADADAAWITTAGAGTDTALRINMGEGATFLKRGKLSNVSKPSNFGTTCIIMATYRVKVTAAYNTKINYGGGAFRYRDTITNTFYTINFPKDSLMVYSSPAACPDGLSPTNIVGDEGNGTFGTPAGLAPYFQSRSTSNTKYSYAPFSSGNPADYFYSVANNTSATGSVVQTVPKGDASRVFSVWDITGDHTGATNTAKGNPPCNLTLPISPANPCGYMLAVNAAYRTDVAFQYNFSGACTDTYYEISTWIKNICYRCGCDSNGVSAGNTGYIPTAAGDSAGVRPNIAVQINGVDYYTTGDLLYQGLGGTNSGSDTLNKWVRRAFVYKTKPGETNFTLTLRNNAPGGGGNDWAMDDIGIRTCYPNMAYSPSATPAVCQGSTLTITDTVRSYYNTYVNYKWQRYTTATGVWADIAGASGTATPTLIGGVYQYVVSYTLPASSTTMANNGDLYRLTVATNLTNLANGCGYNDIIPITITVNPISVDPTSITGPDFCNPGSTTLTAVGGTLATGANYQWGTGSVVGTSPIAGATGSTLPVSPTTSTTYWVRIENPSSVCAPTNGVTKLITVSQPSLAATSANKNKNNICPGISVTLSLTGGTLGTNASWKWYTGVSCGTTFIGTGTSMAVTPAVTTTYYVRAEGDCNTTTCRQVTVFISCDIDKDKDGIPDYVESNIPAAAANAFNTGYPGYVDINNDFVNDNFQADGDSDNDGIPNYLDATYPGRVDVNTDNVDDRFDVDLDGKINMLDLDSDNDGIPDVVEANGVDANGDGLIDNFTDTDGDGLSQNVDANNTGADNTGNGLALPDFDGDGLPNFLDLDSDNDGIPDVVETAGPDSNNDGKLDGFVDINGDGLNDNYINATALLKTGADTNGDGKADSYPNKNLDRDFRPNAYDLDSDGDGIVDVLEAGLPDGTLPFTFNGIVDGPIGTNGWSTFVSGLPVLTLPNTDGVGNPNYLDIDSDNDGIPDNIEGQSTAGYNLPTTTDTDGDGLMLPYDNIPGGFGGAGIFIYDNDGDGTPDYRDLDTDGDGALDVCEGNDWNLNGKCDEILTLTGLDTDGDGLDNRFDSLNSVTNIKGTSYLMGNSGSITGDAAPGTKATVQRKAGSPCTTERDWRCTALILPVQFLNFAAALQEIQVLLRWTIVAAKEVDHFEIERSIDNITYTKTGVISDAVKLNEQQNFEFADNISGINSDIIYYRLKVIGKTQEMKYSNVLVVRQSKTKTLVTMMPNPANDYVTIKFFTEKQTGVTIRLVDNTGKTVLQHNQIASKGNNSVQLNNLTKYSKGIYLVQVLINDEIVTQKLVLSR